MSSDPKPAPSMFCLVARKPGVSPDFFKDYYENSHIPMVNKLIDGDRLFSHWSRHYIQRDGGEQDKVTAGYAGMQEFDAITRIVPRNQEVFEEALRKFHEVEAVIAADEAKFMDRERSKLYFIGDVRVGVEK